MGGIRKDLEMVLTKGDIIVLKLQKIKSQILKWTNFRNRAI